MHYKLWWGLTAPRGFECEECHCWLKLRTIISLTKQNDNIIKGKRTQYEKKDSTKTIIKVKLYKQINAEKDWVSPKIILSKMVE